MERPPKPSPTLTIDCMPPCGVHKKAALDASSRKDPPVTCPNSLIPVAQLSPPGKVPKSCIPPVRVQRNACCCPVVVSPQPTTCPEELMPEAKLKLPPGMTPKSVTSYTWAKP